MLLQHWRCGGERKDEGTHVDANEALSLTSGGRVSTRREGCSITQVVPSHVESQSVGLTKSLTRVNA